MARYLEQANECTDPTTGDYLWIYDASAGSTDKDRKVNISKFAILANAQTFSANQTFTGKIISSAQQPGSGVSMTNNSVSNLSAFTSITNGMLIVVNEFNGVVGTFQVRGGTNAVNEISDPSSVFSHTKDTASSLNIYYESGYKVQNKMGGTITFYIMGLGL